MMQQCAELRRRCKGLGTELGAAERCAHIRTLVHTYAHVTTSSRPASSHKAAAGRRSAAAAAAAPAVAAVAAPAVHAEHPATRLGLEPGLAARLPPQTAAAALGSKPAACRHPLRRCPSRRPPFLAPLLHSAALAAAAPLPPRPQLLSPAARRCCLAAGLAARPRCRCRCCTRLLACAGSWGRTTGAAPPPLAASCRSTCSRRAAKCGG